jgi:integrase
MTPHRTGGKVGHFRFDRIFTGVGRINCSSGTSSKREFARRNAILDELYDAGQLETLRDVKRGDRKAVELRAAARKGKLTGDSLAADLALARPLWDIDKVKGAVSETLDRMKIEVSSRERYYTSFRELQTIAGSVLTARATVATLARVDWDATWKTWKVSNATKNRARAALSAFLTAFLGDLYHPFRREIMKSITVLEEPKLPREITPEEFWTLMESVPDYAVEDFVTLAASGIRVGEYLQCDKSDLYPATRAIHLPGGKSGEDVVYVAEEFWSYVERAIPCDVAKRPKVWKGVQRDPRYKRLRNILADASKATGIKATIHYTRHLFVQLGVDSLPEADVQKAVRHKTRSMTEGYATRRVKRGVADAVGRALNAKKKRAG